MSLHASFLLLLLLFSSVAPAQFATQRFEGRLISNSAVDMLWVELFEPSSHMMTDRVAVARDGVFIVHAIPSQFYEVRVVNGQGDRLRTEHIQFRAGEPAEIRLPGSPTDKPLPGGPISAKRLAHKPDKAAMRLAREANSLLEEGDLAGSTEKLESAAAADPGWLEVWNNLGSRRMSAGKFAEAAEAFRQALKIDSNSSIVHSNLGLANLFLRKPAEAEAEAARALQLEPDSPNAAYVRALALLQLDKATDEALATLRSVSKTLPRARLAVAEWHCRHNNLPGCAAELRTFLKTPRGPNHDAASKWLKEVERSVTASERSGGSAQAGN